MSMNRRDFLEGSSKVLTASILGAGAAISSEAAGKPQPQAAKRKYRLIDTEVHFEVPARRAALLKQITVIPHWDEGGGAGGGGGIPGPKFDEVDNGTRTQFMDQAGVDVAVLSLPGWGVQNFATDTANSVAIEVNDYLADAIKKNPTRYAGFAHFAPQDPQAAAKEIERAITKLKLNGILVFSHTNGEYLDDKKFWPILEAAEALKTPLYIHARTVPATAAPMLRDMPTSLSQAPWGYPSETSLHALRLMYSGALDQFPNLQVCLGHMGEGIPFWLYRIDYWYRGAKGKLKPSEYFKRSFMINTAGMNSHPALKYCHEVLGPDKIMFATDYPYQLEMNEASEFMNTAPFSEADVEKMSHLNAEKYFRIASA